MNDTSTPAPLPDEAPAFTPPTPAEVRSWAVQSGLQVGRRGRISADVQAAYLASITD